MKRIPFTKPYMTGDEISYIQQAYDNGQLSGDGPFTQRCNYLLEKITGTQKALLTHSCTAALEMSAILADIKPGDEVIMPSFTFVSTANAFVLRGGVPTFVDIRRDNLNIDESLIEPAITQQTRAIVVVHYAGVGCRMDIIMDIAQRYDLIVIEDAAHGLGAHYQQKQLGSIGHLGTLSFHQTKNITSGEGGALLINDAKYIERAEIIREKGTNRSLFLKGQVDKYTWVDIGSSYLPGELVAAFLLAQLENEKKITSRRLAYWNHYHSLLEPLEKKGVIERPMLSVNVVHNAHMYYIILKSAEIRDALMAHLQGQKIAAVFHYIPLHTSIAGSRYGKVSSPLPLSEMLSARLLRLPLFTDIGHKNISRVVESIRNFFID